MTLDTDHQRADINAHPSYALGFNDAANLEPLFDDASPEYRAGWLGYQIARSAFYTLAGSRYSR
jgi:hypothetical protein